MDNIGIWSVFTHLLKKKPLGAIGFFLIITMILSALLADFISPYNPVKPNYADSLQGPSFYHWMGTDTFGRDIFTRILHGSQTAMLIGFSTSLIGSILGAFLGVMGAYFGGKTDLILQRILDVFMSFPIIIMALAVVAAMGTGTFNLIIAIAIPIIPRVARVVRSSALAVRQTTYIEAATSIGSSHLRIIVRHMMPNVMAPFLIMMTAQLGQAIVLEASLNFIGLGVAEPTPAWGLMLRSAIDFAESAPWMGIFPGLAISVAVFAFNIFGDSLRDILDPKLG